VRLSNVLFGLLAVCLAALQASRARADNWPSWRGPDNNGISREKGLPVSWSATKNVAWKLPLPKGGSTPVIWGDRMFMTAGEKNKDLMVLCVSTEGKLLWSKSVGTAKYAAIRGDEANEASASPSTDGKHVYVFVASGEVASFDFDGNEIWKINVKNRYKEFSIQHGMHTTPLLHEDRLYLSLLHNKGQWIVALDKATGKEVWKIDRKSDAVGESRESYASPCLWQNGKDLNLVILGSDYTTGHQLSDGAEVWRLGDLNPAKGKRYSNAFRIIASPVAVPDVLVVPTCRGGLVVAVKPGASGSIKTGSEFEQWRLNKGSPDVPSPLVHDGLAYLIWESGVLICVDAKTGEKLYEESLYEDRYRASPVYADGKIYLASRTGHFSVVKAGRKFELLATSTLPDVFAASPAISQGRIYLRGFQALYAIEENGK
jgi:outer membrane protein assembly factor BamB